MVVGHSGKRSRSTPITGAILTRFGLVPSTWTMRIAASGGVDPPGQHEVVLRQAPRGVGGDRDAHLVPGDAQVGMVTQLLRWLDQLAPELDRANEVGQLKGLDDRVSVPLPAVQGRDAGFDVGVGQALHALDSLVLPGCFPSLGPPG